MSPRAYCALQCAVPAILINVERRGGSTLRPSGLRPYTPYETAPLFLALKYLCSTLSGQDCGYRPPLGHSRDPRRARGSGRCPGCPPATTGEMGVGGRFFTFLLGWGIGRYSGLRGSPGVPAMPSKCRNDQ